MGEARNDILSSRGVFHTPYVALNQIPPNIQDIIYRKAGGERETDDPDLYQVVRSSMTNIRYDDFCQFDGSELELFARLSVQAGWTPEAWAQHLGRVDGKLVSESLQLEGLNCFFDFTPKGLMYDNRYISGEITDLEQVEISRYGERMNYWPWPIDVMCQSKDVLIKISQSLGISPDDIVDLYFDGVSKMSGYDFTGGHQGDEDEPMNQNHVREYLQYRAEIKGKGVKS